MTVVTLFFHNRSVTIVTFFLVLKKKDRISPKFEKEKIVLKNYLIVEKKIGKKIGKN